MEIVMFMTAKKIRKVFTEIFREHVGITEESAPLKQQVEDLKTDIATLKHEKKMEVEDIKHMTKLGNEKRDFEVQKKRVELEQEFTEKLNESLKEFHGKMETRFKEELSSFKELYSEIIKRLPDVNVRMEMK